MFKTIDRNIKIAFKTNNKLKSLKSNKIENIVYSI